MMFLLWSDPKASPAARIAGALAAFAARYGVPATLALVAAGEAATVDGCEVREGKRGELVVQPGCVAVARPV